jgi:hypothetical protein
MKCVMLQQEWALGLSNNEQTTLQLTALHEPTAAVVWLVNVIVPACIQVCTLDLCVKAARFFC